MVIHGPIHEDIDPRVKEEITGSQPVEELEKIQVDEKEPTRVLNIMPLYKRRLLIFTYESEEL